MIKIVGLSKSYGAKRVLKNVNTKFEAGKIYGILGRNGAGKTTLVNIITNRAFATDGYVEIDGVRGYENDHAQEKVFCITEKNAYPNSETVRNLFRWAGRFYSSFDMEYALELAQKFDLEVDKKLGKLSTGYTTIAKVILTLASNAPYMIFDEPVLGIDAIYREIYYEELLKAHKRLNNCIILATHILDECERIIDEVIILREGAVVHNSKSSEITSEQSLQSFYLNLHKKTPQPTNECTPAINACANQSTPINVANANECTPAINACTNESILTNVSSANECAPAITHPKRIDRGSIDSKKVKYSMRYLGYITWMHALIITMLCIVFVIIPLAAKNVEMWIELTILINVLILAVNVQGFYFKYALYNGVSRRTYLISIIFTLVGFALWFTILSAITIGIHNANGYHQGLFQALYTTELNFLNTLSLLVWLFTSIMMAMSLGLFGMVLFQTLSRRGKYIAMAILMLIAIVLTLWSSLASWSNSPTYVLLFVLGVTDPSHGTWFATMWFTIVGSILSAISWLILKNIEVK